MNAKMKKSLISTLILAVLSFAGVFAAYAAEGSCTVSIPVEVQVTGSNVPSDAAYRFAMEAVTEGAPMPENAVITTGGSGVIEFGPIQYTQLRDYQYTIRQTTDPRDYFTLDTKVYRVTVRVVTDEAGNYSPVVMAADSQDPEAKPAGLIFLNTYAYTGGNGGEGSEGGNGGGDDGGGGSGPRPGGGDGLTDIGDQTTPLANLTSGEGEPVLESILDELVPLADWLPQTGDSTMARTWAVLTAISAAMLLGLMVTKKRFM